MVHKGVVEELEHSQLVLAPDLFCYNINKRVQDKRPVSPMAEPKEEFDRILKSTNPETDKLRFPLLVGDYRYKTISRYLAFELYCYPEVRKIMK